MHSKPIAQERESGALMVEPDVLAAAEYLERWRYRSSHEPERMLMYAVVDDAITCYQKYSSASKPRGKERFRDVENWLMREKNDWLFSFERICEVLELNPNYIRAGLMRWRSSAGSRPTKVRLFYVVRPGRRVRKTMRLKGVQCQGARLRV
jgi:hypothetical protein